jgi:uncharacterized protein YjbI with pentapeptide repeats
MLSGAGGLVAGLLGTGIANINLDGNSTANVFCFVQVLSIVLTWLFNAAKCKFLKANLQALIVGLTFLLLSLLIGLVGFISNFFLLQFFLLSLAIIAFSLVIFSLSIVDTLFDGTTTKKILYFISTVCFTMASIIVSSTSLINIHKVSYSGSLLFLRLDVLLGFIPIISVAISCLLCSRSSQSVDNLLFYQTWAIALCTFGNTSFYDQDLSNKDFTKLDLANLDLRAKSFYRTCFRGATGLDRARLDDRYFDITSPKVQQLLTQGAATDPDLSALNLQGAYLKAAELPSCTLIDTNITRADLSGGNLRNTNLLRANLSGADLTGADLRGSILVQTDLTGTNLTGTNLTGACIENWNINGRTIFTDVQCDYIYRQLDAIGQPTDRYPRDRDFEAAEFASLYQEVENAVELIFKEGINWRAFAFGLQKLQIDDEGLGIQLRGIEKRGDLWVVKVTHDPNVSNAVVESKLGAAYETLQRTLSAKEQQVNQLLGIMTTQGESLKNQSEALKEFSKKPFGNQFNITGSTITNLAGSGQIEYSEAANQVRNLVGNITNNAQTSQISQQFLSQLQHSLVPTEVKASELIYQVILAEADKDSSFKQLILQRSDNLLAAIPQGPIATAFQTALETLRPQT